jgi:hypothetical protein
MRRSWPLLVSLGAVTGVLAPGAVFAQSNGRIVGLVTDSAGARPLANVGVGVVTQPLGARTDSAGRYTIGNVAPGRYRVRAQLIGFAAREDTVDVAAGRRRRSTSASPVPRCRWSRSWSSATARSGGPT